MTIRDIDPEALATSTHEAMRAKAAELAASCGVPDFPLSTSPSRVRMAVHQLATYATSGHPPEGRSELIAEYIGDVYEVATALDELLPGSAALDTDLGVVIHAASARDALDRGDPVSRVQLAALGGVSLGRIGQLVTAGQLPRPEVGQDARQRLWDAGVAKAWLAGRGVGGPGQL